MQIFDCAHSILLISSPTSRPLALRPRPHGYFDSCRCHMLPLRVRIRRFHNCPLRSWTSEPMSGLAVMLPRWPLQDSHSVCSLVLPPQAHQVASKSTCCRRSTCGGAASRKPRWCLGFWGAHQWPCCGRCRANGSCRAKEAAKFRRGFFRPKSWG